MKHIAFFSCDWLYEIMNHLLDGSQRFLDECADCDLYFFEMFGNYRELPPSESALELFRMPDLTKFDAVVFHGNSTFQSDVREEMISKALGLEIPVVSVNYEMSGATYVGTSNKKSMYTLTETLLKDTHPSSVLYFSGPKSSKEAKARKLGFLQAVGQTGIPYQIEEGGWEYQYGKELGQKLLKTGNIPELIICANDVTAAGLLKTLQEGGVKIPDDTMISGFDNLEIAQSAIPRISTVDRDYETIAYMALKTARELAEGKDVPLFVESPSQLILSESTGHGQSQEKVQEVIRQYFRMVKNNNVFFRTDSFFANSFSTVNSFSEMMNCFEEQAGRLESLGIKLVLNEEWMNHLEDSKKIKHFGRQMILAADSRMTQEADQNHVYAIFPKEELLPKQFQSDARFLIFSSMGNTGSAIGYMVIDGYNPNALLSYNFIASIVKTLGLSLELFIRKKNCDR